MSKDGIRVVSIGPPVLRGVTTGDKQAIDETWNDLHRFMTELDDELQRWLAERNSKERV